MHKTDGERFATTLRTHTFSEPEAVAPPWYAAAPPVEHEPEPATGAADDDVIGRLERLGALYERGILDEAEFATAKADLLRRLSGGTTPS
ncbi:MAG: SHOCT domain-containing protein [Intrasporangiaceae bacterium]|nr:SHOCT domain-containing protein [Intrasporangiaceae bacterium]